MLNTKVRDVLLRAAELIEKYGHVKFTRKDESGRLCLLGALQEAQGIDENRFRGGDTQLTYAAAKAIVETMDIPSYGLADERSAAATWNNKAERTGAEVIEAMRKTAEALDRVSA